MIYITIDVYSKKNKNHYYQGSELYLLKSTQIYTYIRVKKNVLICRKHLENMQFID